MIIQKLSVHPPLLLALSLMSIVRPVKTQQALPPARKIDAIVSTQWLEDNIDDPNLVMLDVRESDFYNSGHITGSISVPATNNFFLCLLDPDCGLWMEVPSDNDLFKTIGSAGISENSTVVVIARSVDSPSLGPAFFGVTMGARVAITLIYAGIDNVAMLDGGYARWNAEGRTTSTEPVKPTPVNYSGVTDKTIFVSKGYVEDKLGKSTLVDTRETDTYFGIDRDFSASRYGHIPTSKVLPAPWFWSAPAINTGERAWLTWKDPGVISEIAYTVLGDDKDEEIIVYCGVGGYASPVYFLLTELLGYTNVKFYDGSMQEWTADPAAPVVKYRYE